MSSLTLKLYANTAEGNEVEESVPLRIFVHERVEQFKFNLNLKNGSVPVAYMENENITPEKNLDIIPRYYVSPAFIRYRNLDNYESVSKFTGVSYTSLHKKIFATNQTAINQKGKVTPLFFKHIVPEGTTRVEIRKVTTRENLGFSEYKFVSSSRSIYNNFVNKVFPDTEHIVYFVDSYSPSGKKTEILNNVSAVAEATWEDIDLDTGAFYDDRYVFTVSANSNGFTYHFSQGDTYWVKPHDENIITPVSPQNLDHKKSWFMKFTDGEVVDFHNGMAKRYSIPEASRELFTPHHPFQYANDLQGLLIAKDMISVGTKNLGIDPQSNRHIRIKLYDFSNNLKRVLTTNSGDNGKIYLGNVRYEYGTINSWSNKSGVIHLSQEIPTDYNIQVDTFFVADMYTYRGMDLNPYTNKKILNNRVVFYLVPNVTEEESAVHTLLVSSEDRIIECSQGISTSYPCLALKNADGTFNPDTIVNQRYSSGESSFVGDYCFGMENGNGYIVLCEVAFLDTESPDQARVVDLLRPGGLPIDQEATYYRNRKLIESRKGWDPRGLYSVKAGAVVVEYPLTLLKDYGGDLTIEETKAFLSKNLDRRIMTVFRPVFPKAKVWVNTATEQIVSFTCSWEGPNLVYTLYRRENESDPWAEISSENSGTVKEVIEFEDTDVVSGDVYSYMVKLTESNIEFPASIEVTVEVK